MEIKKCVRCGGFFSSENEVCGICEKKDSIDVNKLKGFLLEELDVGTTKTDISHSTGITMKNLNRYLNGAEFKGVNIPEYKIENVEDNVVTKV